MKRLRLNALRNKFEEIKRRDVNQYECEKNKHEFRCKDIEALKKAMFLHDTTVRPHMDLLAKTNNLL